MYKEVIRQYDNVSDLINLDSNIRERLKLPQRSLVVTFPEGWETLNSGLTLVSHP